MKKKKEEVQHLEPVRSINFPVQDAKDGRKRLRVQFDITYHGTSHTPSGESETQPDMTLSLGQLLEHHSRGKEIPMKTPMFFETEIPTFNDLTDVDRYKEQLERRLQKTKEFIEKEKNEAFLKQKQTPPTPPPPAEPSTKEN